MNRSDVSDAIRRALERQNITPFRAAVDAGLPDNALRYELEGHDTRTSRLMAICEALGLEFYVGPPRPAENLTLLENLSETGLSADQLRNLESSAQMLNRVVVESGGDPIPGDLRDALLRPDEVAEAASEYAIGTRVVTRTDALAEPGADYEIAEVITIDEVRPAAGDGTEVTDETITGFVPFKRDWFREIGADPGNCVVIGVRGESMEPTLPDGCRILVHRAARERFDGRIFVIRTDDGLVVKRLRRTAAGTWMIDSDHPHHKSRRMARTDEVLGEVIWVSWAVK